MHSDLWGAVHQAYAGDVDSTWRRGPQRREAGLFQSSGIVRPSLASDWPAGGAPLTGAWEGMGSGSKELRFHSGRPSGSPFPNLL